MAERRKGTARGRGRSAGRGNPRRARGPAGLRAPLAGDRPYLRALATGDRPYLVAVFGVLTLASLMISGPLHHYLDGRDRLELLDRKRAMLTAEVQRLERRADELEDPVYVEQLARKQLGLVRPGEIPYLVVIPDSEQGQIAPAEPNPTVPWYRRVWKTLANLVH